MMVVNEYYLMFVADDGKVVNVEKAPENFQGLPQDVALALFGKKLAEAQPFIDTLNAVLGVQVKPSNCKLVKVVN